MTSISRLESVSSKLAEAFRQASLLKQRQAVLEACVVAVSRVGLEENEVNAAVEILRCGGDVNSSVREQLEKLAARFDDQYFELDEKGNEATKLEALALFSKARAASALAFALSENSGQLHEAVYEAITAMNDPAEVMRVVEKTLRSAA